MYEADLEVEGSFDEAVEGCDIVFHTASPLKTSGLIDPLKELVNPALEGTLNVLRAVEKSSSVKRVILTSSIAAIVGQTAEGMQYDVRIILDLNE